MTQPSTPISPPLYEGDTEVFIVRVWVERRDVAGTPPLWRGFIEQVRTNERRYFRSLDDLVAIIAASLEGMGAQPAPRPSVRRWWRGVLARFRRPPAPGEDQDAPGAANNRGNEDGRH